MDDNEITQIVGWPTKANMPLFRRVADAAAVAERERCALRCEAVHCRPIVGAHEEYMVGKEMAVIQCARAIRMPDVA